MLPEDDRMIETCRSVFKCFNVNFRLLKTIYVHFLVCYLNMGYTLTLLPRLSTESETYRQFVRRNKTLFYMHFLFSVLLDSYPAQIIHFSSFRKP